MRYYPVTDACVYSGGGARLPRVSFSLNVDDDDRPPPPMPPGSEGGQGTKAGSEGGKGVRGPGEGGCVGPGAADVEAALVCCAVR